MTDVKAAELKKAFMNLQIRRELHPLLDTDLKVWVHELTTYELETWRELTRSEDENMRRLSAAKLLQMSLHDESGQRIFDDNELGIIGGKPCHVIEPLVRAVLRLSGYGIEAGEEILKNLRKIIGIAGASDLLASSDAAFPNSIGDTQAASSLSNTSASDSGPAVPPPRDSKPN